MSKPISKWIKQTIAFMLIIVMSVPSIALRAHHPPSAQDPTMQQLPEIQPFDTHAPMNHGAVAYTGAQPLAGFAGYATNNIDTYESLLSELCPEYLEAFLYRQYHERQRCEDTLAEEAFHELLGTAARFTSLSAHDRSLIFRHLFIADEAQSVTSALFSLMEQDGFSLAESAALVQILSTGLFS